jgi:hypothetical protein
VVCALAALFINTPILAGNHVNGYYRKDGTYVNGYDRNSSGTGSYYTSPNYSSTYRAPSSPVYYSTPKYATPSSSSYSSKSASPRFYSYRPAGTTSGNSYSHYTATSYAGARDTHGRIIRSEAAKRAFMSMTGFPHGRPGYVVDHIIPLKRGGADAPSNMQWQTIAEGKAKDKWE